MEVNLRFVNGAKTTTQAEPVTKHLAIYPNPRKIGGFFIYHIPTQEAVVLAPFPEKLAIYLCNKMEELFDLSTFNHDTIKDILFNKNNKPTFNFAHTLKRLDNSTYLVTKRAFLNTLNDVKNDNNTG